MCVASSSLTVMTVTGQFDPDAASQRCSAIPEFLRGGCRAVGRLPSRCRTRNLVRCERQAASSASEFARQGSQVEAGLFVCSCAGAAGLAEIVATLKKNFTLW
jgi:hypothetical protein